MAKRIEKKVDTLPYYCTKNSVQGSSDPEIFLQNCRFLSTGGGFPQTSHLPPPSSKVFPEKSEKLFQILILFDDDIKESMKATKGRTITFLSGGGVTFFVKKLFASCSWLKKIVCFKVMN